MPPQRYSPRSLAVGRIGSGCLRTNELEFSGSACGVVSASEVCQYRWMRYADGGGLTPAGREKRERVRRQAAQMFASGSTPAQVAARLEVSTKSTRAWRRTWAAGGTAALASKGPSGPAARLAPQQLQQLERRLQAGPATAGYTEDQRWTLARVAQLIATMSGVRYSLKGVSLLLHRLGWTPQMPVHRAAERDEQAIARWRTRQWPAAKGSRAGWARGSVSPTRRDTR